MKFIKQPGPKEGDIREAHGFLWLPMTIGREKRWLEWATWVETYGPQFTFSGREMRWHPISWRQGP